MTTNHQRECDRTIRTAIPLQNPNDLSVSPESVGDLQGVRPKLTVGSLFAGIGGFDLGLERTGGFEIKWQVEINAYSLDILARHWPDAKRYGDIREVNWLEVESVDVLCGGFPCQDISNAGNRAGIDGDRSGLWSEYVNAIRMVEPRYVIVENVAALLGRGMGRVIGDLAEIGYDAEWDCIPASSIGAHHHRDRVWIVAHRADANVLRPQRQWPTENRTWSEHQFTGLLQDQISIAVPAGRSGGISPRIPNRSQRLKALGNAVVPQIVTWIGQQILDYERRVETAV